MLTSLAHKGCSNRVEMQLLIGDTTLSIAQMGPDFLFIDKTDRPSARRGDHRFRRRRLRRRALEGKAAGGARRGRERVVIAKAV